LNSQSEAIFAQRTLNRPPLSNTLNVRWVCTVSSPDRRGVVIRKCIDHSAGVALRHAV